MNLLCRCGVRLHRTRCVGVKFYEEFPGCRRAFMDSNFVAHMELLTFSLLTGTCTGAQIRCEYGATSLQ
ncbi:hypothetical protein MRX96_017478 [Rhipicephalus microplus]